MSYYKFSENDILYNELKLHPRSEFFIYSGSTYYNQKPQISGTQVDNITHVPIGHTSLYEYNIDREDGQLITPFLTKDGSLTSFKTVSTSNFNLDFSYGGIVSGSYPLSASISRRYYAAGAYDLLLQELGVTTTYRREIEALRNTLNYYAPLNPHYRISSSYKDYTTDELNVIYVPSIFYGSSIEKGSVDLKYFVTGTLIARAQDLYRNGSLIQTWPTASYFSGSNVGIVLYNEGFIFLYDPVGFNNSYELSFDGTDDYLTVSTLYPKYVGPEHKPSNGATFVLASWAEDRTSDRPSGDDVNPGHDASRPKTVSEPTSEVDKEEWYGDLGTEEHQIYYNSYVPPKFNLLPENDFTISAWIKTSASGINPIVVFSGKNLSSGVYVVQYGMQVESGKLTGYVGDTKVTSSTTVNDGVWHHVALVNYVDSGTRKFKIYVDGAAESSTGVSGFEKTPLVTSALQFGSALAATVNYYNGSIDEISIWNDDLTLSDIQLLYHNGCPPNIMNHPRYKADSDVLLAWWRFEKSPYTERIYASAYSDTSYIDEINGYVAYATINPTDSRPSQIASTMACSYSGLAGGHTETYIAGAPSDVTASWVHWGATGSTTDRIVNSSFSLDFRGTIYTPVLTMFSYAPKGELNHTNNLTSMEYPGLISGSMAATSSHSYIESNLIRYKNIASSSYEGYKEPFSKQTYISQIGIYDENKNLIATTKLATPLRKREQDEYIFKLKLDI